jgi:hypothetical protein
MSHRYAYPALQVPKARCPLKQAAAAALAKGSTDVPHAPQLAGSVIRLISQPLVEFPSQSANLQE